VWEKRVGVFFDPNALSAGLFAVLLQLDEDLAQVRQSLINGKLEFAQRILDRLSIRKLLHLN
jgi:hypothetical protein